MNRQNLETYFDKFNANDNELYKQSIPNAEAVEWAKNEVPLFDCPDKTIEETYYFRWWVFRKHIKQTLEGRIITEFLPNVDWSGPYNSINCASGHHIAEARWLRNDRALAKEYMNFWLRGSGNETSYSSWLVDSIYQYAITTGDRQTAIDFLPDCIRFYTSVERNNMTQYDLYWSYDDRDAMEMSISGSGLRPTLNSYMYANARAIAKIAHWNGDEATAGEYNAKADTLRNNMLDKLWDNEGEFFKVVPQQQAGDVIPSLRFADVPIEHNVRELIGYIPWAFGIAPASCDVAWKYLKDGQHFAAPYGLTTAERCHPRFNISCPTHECLWNGPSWPFATTQALNSMIALLQTRQSQWLDANDFLTAMQIYAKSHYRTTSDGKKINWLDENLDGDTGEWISRNILKGWGWREDKGGRERGKDYNHSAFCDLVIRGICGVQLCAEDTLIIKPLLPEHSWPYFSIVDLPYKGRKLSIYYDKTGQQYGLRQGLWAEIDGKLAAESTITKGIEIAL